MDEQPKIPTSLHPWWDYWQEDRPSEGVLTEEMIDRWVASQQKEHSIRVSPFEYDPIYIRVFKKIKEIRDKKEN